MAKKIVVPQTNAGFSSPTENLVGFEIVQGGGLTNTTFVFDYGVQEKNNQDYQSGVFSKGYTLDSLNLSTVEEARVAAAKDLKVYPNFDLTEVTNFTLYGSLTKRMEVSVKQIINFFPAALEVDLEYYDFTTAYTANNVVFNKNENTTSFSVDVSRIKNIFDIDYSVNSARNISLRPTEVSELRDLTSFFRDYSLFINTGSTEYPVIIFSGSQSLTAGTLQFTVSGDCFSGQTTITDSLIIRPNKLRTEKSFLNDFDEVEKFLLNRFVVPKYTAQFKIPRQTDGGQFYTALEYLTWPLNGIWNIDIVNEPYTAYVEQLASFAAEIDEFKTNLISRFLTTGAFHEFDTPDQKVEKALQIYSRSFDETKKFIDALATITSVSYIAGDDIPSALLVYLAKTLGWDINISPISNENFLASVYGVKNKSIYEGWTRDQTPSELNFDYYNKLILNSAHLFRSKGTRRSIEFLMRTVGAPEALVEYNETIYLADRTLKYSDFLTKYAQISGGTYLQNVPGYQEGTEYQFKGKTYTAFTTTQSVSASTYTLEDYPINESGYPKMPRTTSDFFFQKGGGWFQQTPYHNSGQQAVVTNETFTGQSPYTQLQTVPPSYGKEYIDRYINFPNMGGFGFNLRQIKTRDKSTYLQSDTFDSNTLVVNVKNVDLFMNVGQGITYSIWENSRDEEYPIPYTGLSNPYPSPGNIDWTVINPQPQEQTFAEFAQTFYKNMINVRNRWYTNDGKTSGYPTLQSVYWDYLQSLENAGLDISHYTYQKMIDYTIGIGDYWTNLVEQTVPSTTIWNGGIKYENSAFHRQKYVYRRQRGCVLTTVPCTPCEAVGPIFMNDCIDETVSGATFPWSGTASTIESFSDALFKAVNSVVLSSGYTISECLLNSLTSTWYTDVRLDSQILVQLPFYVGYGINDTPTDSEWMDALETNLEYLYQNGMNYNINEERIIISNSGCMELFKDKTLSVNMGINVSINCN